MSKHIAARMFGDDYQALFFWMKVCDMLQDHKNIEKVAFEYDEFKAFDDVVVFYKDPIPAEGEDLIEADYFQLKYHVNPGDSFTWENLMDPTKINATSVSILQRAYNAQKQFEPNEMNIRFYIVTDWQIHPDDTLAELVNNQGGQIRFDKLSQGKTEKSKMGKIRESWKKHLGLETDEELERALKPIRFTTSLTNLSDLKNQLNNSLMISGLKPISTSLMTNQYIDLVQAFMKNDVHVFNKEEIIEACKREGLWTGKSLTNLEAENLGVRSFSRYSEYLDDEMDHLICLLEHFDGREIKNEQDWEEVIKPTLEDSLNEAAKGKKEYHLHLETHASIAFTVGRLLEPKSGVNVSPIQKGREGSELWKIDDGFNEGMGTEWLVEQEVIDKDAEDIAVVIAVRHQILDEVKYYLKKENIPIKKIICLIPNDSPGASVIKGGGHAWYLADKLATELNSRSFDDREGHMHIFLSGPNALTFFIGQLSKAFGDLSLYEYNFERRKPGDYNRSITFYN
ncbi:SAVED domain-containing protein [Halobacillus trueperi]|uniref:SAVED domain-containing protein n=1 Tax=Halobacillus trueperi TaxID=156205 RepID=A0A3D8VT43_9BACI|nr:SAVED domain-containing protein [Halobacillus trueperi]RDY72582.1 SAVED domain-containing protein [Halobacillus trueperi]